MRKKIFFILALVVLLFSLSSCKEKTTEYTKDDYTLHLELGKNTCNVLQITDLHLGQMDKLEDHYAFITKVVYSAIDRTGVDLIAVTGDLFTFATKENAVELFNYLDSFEIPWTVTFGNHDEQCYFSIDWLTNYLNSLNDKRLAGKSYCYFKDLQDDAVKGNANFVILLENKGVAFEQVVVMDSNRYTFGTVNGYDYMDETQMNWFDEVVDDELQAIMLFHIPLNEFSKYDDGANKDEFVIGEYGEDACDSDVVNGFFTLIKTKNVDGLFVGHDHVNDYSFIIDGVIMSYGVKTTDRVYYEEGMLGGQIIHLEDGKQLQPEDLTHILFESYDDTANYVTGASK